MLEGIIIGYFFPIFGIIFSIIAIFMVIGLFLTVAPGVLSYFGIMVFVLGLIYFARLLYRLNGIRLFNQAVRTGGQPDTDWIKLFIKQIEEENGTSR